MKSPKLSVVALLSVMAVSSVFAGDNGAAASSSTAAPVDAPAIPTDAAEPSRLSRMWTATTDAYDSAATRVSETAANWPKTSAVMRGGTEGLAVAGAVHGAYKLGQYAYDKRPSFLRGQDESASTEETTTEEDTRPWYKRPKPVAAALTGTALLAAPFVAKACRVDFSTQKDAVFGALKTAGSYLADKGSNVWNWVTNNKVRLASQATAVAAYVGVPKAINCFKSTEETPSTEETSSTTETETRAAARDEAARSTTSVARPAAARSTTPAAPVVKVLTVKEVKGLFAKATQGGQFTKSEEASLRANNGTRARNTLTVIDQKNLTVK